jgi:hypothetical protein
MTFCSRFVLLGAGSLLLLMQLSCAGSLEDPESFLPPDSGEASSGSDAGDGDECVPGVTGRELLLRHCTSGCHSANARAAGLDLESERPGVRLLNAPATLCADQILLTEGGGGYLFIKLVDAPACGARMPVGGGRALTAAEMECLREYLLADIAAGEGG